MQAAEGPAVVFGYGLEQPVVTELAFTGGPATGGLVRLGLALVGLGALALLAGRRTRRVARP